MDASKTEIRIETDRLILRPLLADDAERIAALINDFDITRMLARVPWPYRLEDAEDFLARVDFKDPAKEQPLAVEHRRHGLIGVTGFHRELDSPLTEFGYWLARDHWGQGYATEAGEAALIWAHESWGKRAVVARHFVDNPASGRVLAKCGFLYTGVVEPRPSLARGVNTPSRAMVRLA